MSEAIKKVSLRNRRIVAERVRKMAKLLRQDDVEGAVEFVDGKQHNLLNRTGCAKVDSEQRGNINVCLQCGNFDKLSFVCRVS